MLFWLHIVPYIADGPLWYQLYSVIDKQQSYWWSTLLYVQNLYPTNLSNSVSPFSIPLCSDGFTVYRRNMERETA